MSDMPTIDDVDCTCDQLEELLKRYGIAVATGSRLEASRTSLDDATAMICHRDWYWAAHAGAAYA
jgi:hypothetical protein